MKKLYRIIVLIIIGVSINACYYDTLLEVEEPTPPEPGEDVSYKDDIMPLWNVDCVFCHKGDVAPDLRDEFSYNSLIDDGFVVKGDADASLLYKSLLGIDGAILMPPESDWSEIKIGLVKEWINQGAKDN